MTRLPKASIVTVLGVLAWLGGCSDTSGPGPCPTCPQGLILSNPVPAAAATTSSLAFTSGTATDVVYVSLPPGAVPTGSRARVRRVGDAGSIATALVDGGFDPVPVAAQVGDSIEVVVTDAGGTTVFVLGAAVRPARPPIIVRTDPPPKKRDVPLNAAMVIVFSEPVAGGSITTSSLQLYQGTTPIAGTVSLLGGSATAAVFIPDVALDVNTDYRLDVTPAVRDLQGDALAAAVSVDFTTGTTVVGPVASVSLGLRSDSATLVPLGSQFQLTAMAKDVQGVDVVGRPVTWSSTDSVRATVSATGLVTALAEGGVTITATVDGQSGQAMLAVTASLVPVGYVTVTPESARVTVSGAVQLSAIIRDTAGQPVSHRLVTWSSNNPTVATVAGFETSALVTGVADGTAKIVVTAEGKSDTSNITVGPPLPAVALILSPDSALTLMQQTVALLPYSRDVGGSLTPLDPTQVAWASSDFAIASVNGDGWVTGQTVGSATITGTWNGFHAAASVNVVTLSFTLLSASAGHTCGLTSAGTAWCWGLAVVTGGWIPGAVQGGLTFFALGTGQGHTCGLATGGAAYCWGYNGGRLGNGTFEDSYTPVSVSGGHSFVALTAGLAHTCALTGGGAAYCWGDNVYGQLGDGTTTNRRTPALVTGGHAFTALSAGSYHTCGLTMGGAAYCWGYNGSGELGVGSTGTAWSTAPRLVMGGHAFTALSAGGGHTCGLTSSGVVYCWGNNDHGQLGTGTTNGSSLPVPVVSGLSFTTVSPGQNYTCGIATSGAAYCWGIADNGVLGNGTFAGDLLTPTAVYGGLVFSALSTLYHTCGVTTTRVAYCWGANWLGELGDGTTTSSNVPVKVAGQP